MFENYIVETFKMFLIIRSQFLIQKFLLLMQQKGEMYIHSASDEKSWILTDYIIILFTSIIFYGYYE